MQFLLIHGPLDKGCATCVKIIYMSGEIEKTTCIRTFPLHRDSIIPYIGKHSVSLKETQKENNTE